MTFSVTMPLSQFLVSVDCFSFSSSSSSLKPISGCTEIQPGTWWMGGEYFNPELHSSTFHSFWFWDKVLSFPGWPWTCDSQVAWIAGFSLFKKKKKNPHSTCLVGKLLFKVSNGLIFQKDSQALEKAEKQRTELRPGHQVWPYPQEGEKVGTGKNRLMRAGCCHHTSSQSGCPPAAWTLASYPGH